MSEREKAQQKRNDARRRRRAPSDEPKAEAPAGEASGGDREGADEPIETVKQAAKVAAAAAAVGAAVGAARAMTGGHDDGEADEGGDGGDEGGAAPESDATPEAHPKAAGATARDEDTQPDVDDGAEDKDDAQGSQHSNEPVRPVSRHDASGGGTDERSESRPASAGAAQRAVQQAREHLKTLSGHDAESVSSFEPAERGWKIGLEVLEVSRVPASTDVLATYEVTVDSDGDLVSYSRTRRYYRSQAASEDGR